MPSCNWGLLISTPAVHGDIATKSEYYFLTIHLLQKCIKIILTKQYFATCTYKAKLKLKQPGQYPALVALRGASNERAPFGPCKAAELDIIRRLCHILYLASKTEVKVMEKVTLHFFLLLNHL